MTREDLKRAWKYLKGDGCTAVPDLGFSEDCNKHDKDYRLGVDENGEKLSRWRADWRLFKNMLFNKKQPIPLRLVAAPVFWLGVRVGGGGIWKGYRDKEGGNE